MRAALLPACLALALGAGACIPSNVLATEDRAVDLEAVELAWAPATADAVPGTYVSTDLSGPLAASLRKLVYLFEPDGAYAGAALVDTDPPHFELIGGTWELTPEGLSLDGGPLAVLELAPDGSLRLTGAEGRVVLRRERAR